MTVRLVTDSSCDLPQAMADALGIRIVPLSVRFGDTEYIDRTTITTDEFWKKCAASARRGRSVRPRRAYRRCAGDWSGQSRQNHRYV